jgi:predicted AAA+ superfamily ATPase
MEVAGFLKEQIVSRLKFDNPWWITRKIADDYHQMKHRLYMDLFCPLVTDTSIRRGVILMGPRRVGKTVMLYHTIEYLIEKGINPQKIIYLSIDTPIYNNISLEELFAFAREALGQADEHSGFYVFYDEIQYLKDWEVHLKSLIDSFREVKFVASGSAAAALKMKSQESGAGRFSDFMLPPLTFHEYIHLLGLESLMITRKVEWANGEKVVNDTIDIGVLNGHFVDYINYGGYPEIVFSEKMQANPGQYIRHDIVDKVLLRDLPSLYGINDTQELNRLFVHIAFRSGGEFTYENLSQESGINKETLKKYIQYLEAAFLIKVIHKTDIDARKFKRITAFKIYLTNPSLRCALFSPLKDTDAAMGNMVETAIFAQWFQFQTELYYANWRNGRREGEVDMIQLDTVRQKPDWAVEIKWSDRYVEQSGELKSLLQFLTANSLSEATVTTLSKYERKNLDQVSILFIPSAVYAYTLGKNLIKEKQSAVGL